MSAFTSRMRRAFLSSSTALNLYIYAVGTQNYGQFGFGNATYAHVAPIAQPYTVIQLNSSAPSSVPYSVGETIYQGSSLAAATATGVFLSFTAGGYYNMILTPKKGVFTTTGGTITGATHATSYTYGSGSVLNGPPEPDIWTQISLRFNTTLGIKSDGTLWGAGCNLNSQLGTGANSIYNFTRLGSASNFIMCAPGDEFIAALDSNGNIWTAGNNNIAAQIHNGTTGADVPTLYNTSLCPTANHPALLNISGAAGTFTPNELLTQSASGWGGRVLWHNTTDNILTISNTSGTLAAGTIVGSTSGVTATVSTTTTTPPFFKYLNVGHRYVMAIDSYGHLWSWGNNGGSTECGRPSQTTQTGQPDSISNPTQDLNCRYVTYPGALPFPGKWLAVYPGAYSCMALSADGLIYGWGQNTSNQLGAVSAGASTTTPHVIPCAAGHSWISGDSGDYHSMLLRDDGTLWGCGTNSAGQVGNGSTSTPSDFVQIPLPVVGGVTGYWAAVSCGYTHTLAIDNLGNLWGWGDNSTYQLGLSSTGASTLSPILLDSTRKYSSVTCGQVGSMALAFS